MADRRRDHQQWPVSLGWFAAALAATLLGLYALAAGLALLSILCAPDQ
jgi:hypothetical protein